MFACIYVPNFPVAAALRAEPELRRQAVAIFEGNPPLEKIIAVNEKARRVGIVPAMTKTQAELCAALVLRSRSALQESAAHAALLDCAQSFSPCVEDTACNMVLVDLAGMESLFGTLPEISHALANRLVMLGFEANIAVASNSDAATLAARGFSGVKVIPSGNEAQQLGSLPIEVLFTDQFGENSQPEDPTQRTALRETLDRWGIRNLRALAALPEIALSERLGQEGVRLRQLARGAALRTLVPVEEPLVFEEAVELEHPIVLLEPLAFLLNRMLEQICARLGLRALATEELRLTLELAKLTGIDDEFENLGMPSESDGTERLFPSVILSGADSSRSEASAESNNPGPEHRRRNPYSRPPIGKQSEACPLGRQTKFVRTLNLPLPMLDAKLFLKLLQLDLNAHPPGAPIVKIHLAAEPAHPRPAQGGLFLPPSPEPEKLELTLTRIAGMVGEHKVGAPELLDTHHPEGFRMRRFVADVPRSMARRPSPAKPAPGDEAKEKSAVTALRRFRPPLRANVTLENGQPVHLACPKKKAVQGNVLWKAGPWRFSGDWWEREAWSRDEWDIALQNDASRNGETIALYRLVHDLLGGGWFVEGTYD